LGTPASASVVLMRRWLLLGCAIVIGGCAEPRSRTFAITLLDAPTVKCTGYADGLLADPDDLDDIAKDMRKAYKEAKLAEPPTPQGRVLHVNELETRTQAWFDPSAVTSTGSTAPPYDSEPGTPPRVDQSIPAAVHYDDPTLLYEGEPLSDYIEARTAQVFNTDEQDEEQSLRLCGPRARTRGTLTLTTTDGIAGRIRWTEVEYVPSELSPCEGRIECVRDIAVEGLEAD